MTISSQYAAGIIDGEGCISFSGLDTRKQLTLSVSNRNKEMLEALRETYGGKIYEIKSKSDKHSAYYNWVISCGLAADVLRDVLPHMIVKFRQAELALIFQSTVRPTPRGAPRSLPQEIVSKRKEIRGEISLQNRGLL